MFCLVSKSNKETKTQSSNYSKQVYTLDTLKHVSHGEFERLNWLPVTYRFKQCVNTIAFKYFNGKFPNYLNEAFDVAVNNNFQLRSSFQKLKCPFRKANTDQLALSYFGPTF